MSSVPITNPLKPERIGFRLQKLPGEGQVTEAVFDFAERMSPLPEGSEPTLQPSPVAAPAEPTPAAMTRSEVTALQ